MDQAIHFREGTAADRGAVLALRGEAFPDPDKDKRQADFWQWQFVEGYAGEGRFFVAEAADRIVGHFGFLPQRYVAGQAIRGALAVDVMVHPEFRRQKVFSRLASFAADRLRDDFQIVTAFQIRRAVLGGMVAGGWHPVAKIPVLLKPLSLRRILRDLGLPLRDSASEDVAAMGHSIRSIPPADFGQIDRLLAGPAIRQPRSVEFLHWRYARNPRWHYEMKGFYEGDELRAFVIHRPAILRGLRALAVADAGLAPRSEASLRELIGHVCAAARARGMGIASALLSRDHSAYGALRRSGFIPGPHRFRLLLQVFDDALNAAGRGPWSLSWGDTDHL